MAVTIYAWTHNLDSVIASLLNKTNCGHCSLEISGTEKSIKKIKDSVRLRNHEYQRALKLVENFLHTPQHVDQFMPQESSEAEKINARKNDLDECISAYKFHQNSGILEAGIKQIKVDVLEAGYYVSAIDEKLENAIAYSDTLIHNTKIHQMYFSFFPDSERELNFYPQNGKDSPSNNLYSMLCRKKISATKYAAQPKFHSFITDCNAEISGVDISKIFADISPENLEEDTENYTPRNEFSKNHWYKKERKIFKIKSGNLKGLTITQATFSEYKNFFNFIFNYKNINFRSLLLDEEAVVDQSIFNRFLEKDKNYFIHLLEDLSKNILILKHNKKNAKSSKEIEILNNKINRLKKLISHLGKIYSNVKNYLYVSGLPPSEIITFPSKTCDGYGLDEVTILEKWIYIVADSGYHFDTTNCSWAIKTIFLPAAADYLKPRNHLRLMPWSPLEVASFAKEAQKEFFKKHPHNVFKNNMNPPKKYIYTKNEFFKIISKNNLSIKFQYTFHIQKTELDNILGLLEKYQQVADFQINYRLSIIKNIKEKLVLFTEEIAGQTKKNNVGNKMTSINMLFQIILFEEESLIAFLMGVKGRDLSNVFR